MGKDNFEKKKVLLGQLLCKVPTDWAKLANYRYLRVYMVTTL